MTCDNGSELFVRRVAGIVILTGFLLGWFVDGLFYLVVAFAGANLLQSSFTGFCPPEILHERFLASDE
jgi:hypothetical protein